MHFATHVTTWHAARLYSVPYSEIALSQKPFGIADMFIYAFLLYLSSWDTLYIYCAYNSVGRYSLVGL
jgi:hypothetical protein